MKQEFRHFVKVRLEGSLSLVARYNIPVSLSALLCCLSFYFSPLLCRSLLSVLLQLVEPKPPNGKHNGNNQQLQYIPKCLRRVVLFIWLECWSSYARKACPVPAKPVYYQDKCREQNNDDNDSYNEKCFVFLPP